MISLGVNLACPDVQFHPSLPLKLVQTSLDLFSRLPSTTNGSHLSSETFRPNHSSGVTESGAGPKALWNPKATVVPAAILRDILLL